MRPRANTFGQLLAWLVGPQWDVRHTRAASVVARSLHSRLHCASMVHMAKTFRLGDRDEQELERLADELDCTQVDVVRKGLLALRIMRKQGYSLDWAGGADIVLRRDGDTVSWYTLTGDDELVLIGEQPATTPRDE